MTQKLHIVVQDSSYAGSLSGLPSGNAPSGDSVLPSVYTLQFSLMSNSNVLRLVNALEATHVHEIELLKSTSTARTYSVTTNKNLGELEEIILKILIDQKVNIDHLRITSFGTEIKIEAL